MMTDKTNMKNALKTVILSGALSAALAIPPTLVMADSHDDGRRHQNYSSATDKQHNKDRYRGSKHADKTHDGKGHKFDYRHSTIHRHSKAYARPYKHVDYNHGHHKYRYNHDHKGHGHNHARYVVNEYYYDDHYDLDHLRFMIGLHTHNLDIILRE